MNPNLSKLQPYPFEKLRRLFEGVTPATDLSAVRMSIGEPQHATPAFIKEALTAGLGGLANYPTTAGSDSLRATIAAWIGRRYQVPAPDPATQVLPVTGSREALFALAQCVIDGSRPGALVLCPNPFYQIYEGAAYLAGAMPVFVNQESQRGFACDYGAIPAATWERVQLVYVCSPGNPTGNVMTLDQWRGLFELSDRYGFTIAADECYSELYFDEDAPPLGVLQAAHRLERGDYRRLIAISSLSKRSNVPGMRSGFVAGDAAILKQFLLYRTYHGCAMNPAVQAASQVAWSDEAHVAENRRLYREKFAQVTPIVAEHLGTAHPDAGFYLWASVAKFAPIGDDAFARRLYAEYNVSVLPGSYLARETRGGNPGAGYIRIALVAPLAECLDAAKRIAAFCTNL